MPTSPNDSVTNLVGRLLSAEMHRRALCDYGTVLAPLQLRKLDEEIDELRAKLELDTARGRRRRAPRRGVASIVRRLASAGRRVLVPWRRG